MNLLRTLRINIQLLVNTVSRYLSLRYSFYESLYKKYHWIKPIADRCFNKDYDSHPLRNPSPQAKGKVEKWNNIFLSEFF